MPIPTRHDGQLSEIESMASSILLSLRTIRHANSRDIDRMRRVLRERLQDYANAVIDLANE